MYKLYEFDVTWNSRDMKIRKILGGFVYGIF